MTYSSILPHLEPHPQGNMSHYVLQLFIIYRLIRLDLSAPREESNATPSTEKSHDLAKQHLQRLNSMSPTNRPPPRNQTQNFALRKQSYKRIPSAWLSLRVSGSTMNLKVNFEFTCEFLCLISTKLLLPKIQ
jgi:hypothetical protein